MVVNRHETLAIVTDSDVVAVRHKVRDWSKGIGFRLVDLTRVVTAASELARNTLEYGGGGHCLVEEVTVPGKIGLRLTFTDKGPGIVDLGLAMTDGYTTGSGLGMGLSGAKRLTDQFQLDSAPGKGTRVLVVKWK